MESSQQDGGAVRAGGKESLANDVCRPGHLGVRRAIWLLPFSLSRLGLIGQLEKRNATKERRPAH